MRFEAITKNQTTIIKGVAILFIMCHNFLHWIEPVKNSENEFYYWPTHLSSFVDSFFSYPGVDTDLLNHLLQRRKNMVSLSWIS